MKKILLIASYIAIGLFLKTDGTFAYNSRSAQEGVAILNRLTSEKDDNWTPSGPTREDIEAATKVENQAVKGSLEDKLINAVKNGNYKEVKALIAAGSNLECRDNQDMTALMQAADKGYSDIVKMLIDTGADINAMDKFGCTAFFKAADKNRVDVIKILITKGAATDKKFEDIFVSAVFKGNTEMVKALMIESDKIKHDTLDTAYMMALNNRRRNPEIFTIIEKALNKEYESL